MKILDTNMILIYLLHDKAEMADTVTDIIKNNIVTVPVEVIAEVVYVLSKVYKADRKDIRRALFDFFNIKNVTSKEYNVICRGLSLYASNNLDFVDCILCAYHLEYGYEICTFDKKLNALIDKTNM